MNRRAEGFQGLASRSCPTLRSRYGIQLPHFEPIHVTTLSNWLSELSASLVIPANKLARQRLRPVDRKGSYDVPGVVRLQKRALFFLAYEAFVNIRRHVDAAHVSDLGLHLRPS